MNSTLMLGKAAAVLLQVRKAFLLTKIPLPHPTHLPACYMRISIHALAAIPVFAVFHQSPCPHSSMNEAPRIGAMAAKSTPASHSCLMRGECAGSTKQQYSTSRSWRIRIRWSEDLTFFQKCCRGEVPLCMKEDQGSYRRGHRCCSAAEVDVGTAACLQYVTGNWEHARLAVGEDETTCTR